MIIKFKTKRDTNGNVKALIIDTDSKTVKRDYNPFCTSDFVEVKKIDFENLFTMCMCNSYTWIS